MPEEITLEIKNVWTIASLSIICLVFIWELIEIIKLPIVFGDEGFHAKLAQLIAEKQEYFKYYTFTGSELQRSAFYRAPFWEFLVASFYFLFGFNDIFIKVLTPFVSSFLGGIVTFILVKKLYGDKFGFLSALIILTVPSIVTYAMLVYADSLFWLYFSSFILVFILALEEDKEKYYLLAGLFGALAFLTKSPGILVPAIVFFVFLYQILIEKKSFNIWKKYFILIIPLILVSSFLIRNFANYGTLCNIPIFPSIIKGHCDLDNYTPKYTFSGRTEQTGTEQNVFNFGINNYLAFAYGNLWLVPFAFAIGVLFLFKNFNRKTFVVLLSLGLLALAMTSTEVNSRAEDTARYSIGFVPIIAIVSSMFFINLYEFLEKNYKYLGLSIIVFVLFLSYSNFSDKLNTMKSVKSFSSSFFEACDWIKANTPTNSRIMTVWVWHTTYNCQRNVMGNLPDLEMSQDLNFSLNVAKLHNITHIFIQKFSLSNEYLSEKYNVNFVQFLENNSNCFKKIYENGPSLQQCLQQGGCDGTIVYEINKECLK